MPKKRITFIVIPPNDKQIQEFRFSAGLLWLAGLLLVAFACAFGYFSTGYFDRVDQHEQVTRLGEENADLSQGLDRTRKLLTELELAMAELARDDERLRYLHEMPSLSPEDRSGMGGGDDLPEEQYSVLPDRKRELLMSLAGRIKRLRLQVRQQEESFDKIGREYLLNGDSLRIVPSISPVSRDLTWKSSPFGKRNDPFTGAPARHLGIDIAGRKGTPVVATADGVVMYAYKQDIRLGNVVVIRHEADGENEKGEPYKVPGKYRTEYGHLDKILVKKGDKVKRGDQVGTMGSTGRSTGPHLHYGVRYQDRRKRDNRGYLDPEDFLLDWPKDTRVSGYLSRAEH